MAVVVHIAGIAAAVDRAHAARVQLHHGHSVHGGSVVAAEEAAYIVAAQVTFPLVNVRVAAVVGGIGGGVGPDEVAVVAETVYLAVAQAFHSAVGLGHGGVVAAEEHGVAHAAEDPHVGVRAVHQVAAAEEVAYAEVASVAAEQGILDVLLVGELGVEDVDEHRRGRGHLAAVVVAAEDGHQGAAVDVDGNTVGRLGL